MTTYTDETVSNLVINKLTKAQYEAIQNPSDTELYIVEDATLSYNDLSDKPFIPSAVTDLSDATNYALKAEIKTVNGNSLIGSGNLDIDGLPSQTGNSGKYLTTNGTSASWATVSTPSEVEWATYGTTTYQQIKEWNDEGKIVFCTYTNIIYRLVQVSSNLHCEFTSLFNDGIQTRTLRVNVSNNWSYNNVFLQNQIPAGTSGNILTYTGTAGSVGSATINDIVPSQSGNSGKFLTTNGSAVSWGTVSIPTVDQTYDSTSANAQSGVAIQTKLSSDYYTKAEVDAMIGNIEAILQRLNSGNN